MGGGAVDTARTGGPSTGLAAQPRAQSTGNPFRISVLAGASKKAGGFMAVSACSQRLASDRTMQPQTEQQQDCVWTQQIDTSHVRA